MQKYITGLLLVAAVFLLGGCGSTEDKVLSNIETIEEGTAPELTNSIQSIIDYEKELSGLFNESLTDEALTNFKDDQSALYQNLNERTELVEELGSFQEELTNLAEDFNNIEISESEQLTEEMINNTSAALTSLAEETEAIEMGYTDVASEETVFFETLAGESADYNTLTDGMEKVNELHSQVSEHYKSINDQLQAFQNYSNEIKTALGEEDGSESLVIEENEAEIGAENNSEETLYTVDAATSNIVPISDDTESSAVLLTIDDAPDQYAVDMAHTLKELDAPAIFFVNGMYIESEEGKKALREIHELGFEIGNHTYNHLNMQEITPEDTRLEIVDTSDLIEEAIGERPSFFRAPFGVNSEASLDVVVEENMTAMNWTYGFDWEPDYQEKSALADIMVNTEMLGDGANLLMHDREWTAGALTDIVAGLRDKGYELIDPKSIDREGGVTE